jgi:hypothetical protein
MRLLEQSRGLEPQVIEEALVAMEREAENYRLRMADLVSAARDAAGMQQICIELAQAGLEAISREPFNYKTSTLLGWALAAQRA